MLGTGTILAMAATSNADAARAFYVDTLGLTLQEETPFALVLTSGGVMLRVQKVAPFTPHPFTQLGWAVPDIGATVRALTAKSIVCERIEGLQQGTDGVWAAPNGDRIAWFKDPDGNILSLTQFA